MSGRDTRSAEALRRAFDDSFAEPPPEPATDTQPFLLVRASGDPYAIALAEIALFARCPPITALPSSAPALCGIASVRSALVAVYDLALLLGIPGGSEPRWIVLDGADRSIGYAFDAFEGHAAIAAADIARATRGRQLVAGHIVAGEPRGIVDLRVARGRLVAGSGDVEES